LAPSPPPTLSSLLFHEQRCPFHPNLGLALANTHYLSVNRMDPNPSSRAFPFVLKEVFHFAAHQDQIPWQPYKKGVDIFRLYGDGITGPTAALVRFREHGEVPMHEHKGYEHILVLSGSQRDEAGISKAGTLVINPPGTRHKVHSDAGCIVLAIYEKPVEFAEDVQPTKTEENK
jgi:anti-sigma factor ChrR (cupin superfamily)